MGAEQERIVQRFLDAWGDGQAGRPDVEAISAALSEDVAWHLWMPAGPVLRGRAAVIKDIERQLRFATHMHCRVVAMTSNDTTVITERHDTFRSGATVVDHRLCAVFELDAGGRIVAWREYFDVADVNEQLRAANATVPRVSG